MRQSGSVVALVHAAGTKTATYAYDPYGVARDRRPQVGAGARQRGAEPRLLADRPELVGGAYKRFGSAESGQTPTMSITWNDACAYAGGTRVCDPIRTEWLTHRGEGGWLGSALAPEAATAGGKEQAFGGGFVSWSATTGATDTATAGATVTAPAGDQQVAGRVPLAVQVGDVWLPYRPGCTNSATATTTPPSAASPNPTPPAKKPTPTCTPPATPATTPTPPVPSP